ncbi:MAG: tripartite tricarboxylate transporter substrate binding protein [Burkholderiales bacterium]|nr:tripartite tricarboxylate transporter substrate binding protein [Burkholderiales bacterium]
MSYSKQQRRGFIKALTIGGAGSAAPKWLSANTSYPNRPIRLIVPWTAGGSSDLVLRVVGQKLTDILGVPIAIENKPGASGTLGIIELLKAKPDGYTLTQIPLGVISAPLMRSVPYDPLTDISYIANLSSYTNGLVVRANSPIRTVQDYISQARAQPGTVSYAVAGLGTYAHLATEEFAYRAGIKLLGVPYKGDADALQGLLGGHVMSLASSTSWAANVDDGSCRLLAVYSQQRIDRWPSAPTFKELGFDTIPDSPFGIAGPKGMSPDIIAKLEAALKKVMGDPAVIDVLGKFNMPVSFLGTPEYRRMIESTYHGQAQMIKRLGLGG